MNSEESLAFCVDQRACRPNVALSAAALPKTISTAVTTGLRWRAATCSPLPGRLCRGGTGCHATGAGAGAGAATASASAALIAASSLRGIFRGEAVCAFDLSVFFFAAAVPAPALVPMRLRLCFSCADRRQQLALQRRSPYLTLPHPNPTVPMTLGCVGPEDVLATCAQGAHLPLTIPT